MSKLIKNLHVLKDKSNHHQDMQIQIVMKTHFFKVE